MKKIIYKSWVARHLLFPGYSTITLAAWVCTKWSKEEMLQTTKNHECTHARQWCECMIASDAGVRDKPVVARAFVSDVLCVIRVRMGYQVAS